MIFIFRDCLAFVVMSTASLHFPSLLDAVYGSIIASRYKGSGYSLDKHTSFHCSLGDLVVDSSEKSDYLRISKLGNNSGLSHDRPAQEYLTEQDLRKPIYIDLRKTAFCGIKEHVRQYFLFWWHEELYRRLEYDDGKTWSNCIATHVSPLAIDFTRIQTLRRGFVKASVLFHLRKLTALYELHDGMLIIIGRKACVT